MASIQELESKVLQLERMLVFVMNSFATVSPSRIIGGEPTKLTMLDMYYEAAARGETNANQVANRQNNGESKG